MCVCVKVLTPPKQNKTLNTTAGKMILSLIRFLFFTHIQTPFNQLVGFLNRFHRTTLKSQVGGYFKKITVMAPSCTLTIHHSHRCVSVAFHLNIFIDSQTHRHIHIYKISISPSPSFPFSQK